MFKFLEKLQNSDESVKRKWTFILTAVAMIVVIYIWLAYFNNLIAGLSAQPEPEKAEAGFTFWQTVKNGAAIVYDGLTNKLRWFGEVLSEPREYIIPAK